MQQPSQFNLNMDAEVAQRSQQQSAAVDSGTSTEIAARIGELMKAQGISEEANPLAAEKIQRDLDYQRQIEQLPQPESAPPLAVETTPELDRLESLQQQLDAAKAEATRWKKEFGRREGTVGQMKTELQTLKAQVMQLQPAINVQQITGRAPDEPLTAQDAVNLLMSQSNAFGNVISQIRQEIAESRSATPADGGLPLDMEAELVEAHPWLTDLPRPQKMRAMHDILASSGVSVTPPSPVAGNAPSRPATLPDQARAPVRQVAYIEPSNRGSAAERNAIAPERQAFNEKLSKLKEALAQKGGSDKAAELLAALGAGPVDETQMGYLHNRR